MKKTFQQIVSKFWYILLCTVVVSCSNSDSPTIEPLPEPNPDPEPVVQNYRLKDGVNEIKGGNLNYVVEAIEGTTLVLSNSYPSDEVPVVGEIVFVYPNAEKLPFGFLGRVSEISQSGGNYNLKTEQVALDEAFSYLSVNESVDMELYAEGEEIAESRVASESINGYQCLSQELKAVVKLSEQIEVGVKGKLTYGLRMVPEIQINDSTNTNYIRIEFSQYKGLDSELHFETKKEGKNPDWLAKGRLKEIFDKPLFRAKIPAGVASFFAAPYIDVNLATKLGAALSLGIGAEISSENSLAIVHDNGEWRLEHNKKNGGDPVLTFLPSAEMSIEGSAFAGVDVNPNICLFNRSDMSIELECALGPKVSAELSYDSEKDKNLYDALKDDKASMALSLIAEAKATANIFSLELEWTAPLLDVDLWTIAERYIFPDFTDCTIGKVEEGKYNVAGTTLKRDILFNTPVGIAAFDENDSIKFETDPKTYRLEKNFEKENPIELKFENTDENNKYSIWSYVKWGKEYIKCERLDIDIYGLWCREKWHEHFEFCEDGKLYRYDERNGVWESGTDPDYERWWWGEENCVLTSNDPDLEVDEVWKIEKLTSDSLIILNLTESWDPEILYFRRINNHSECTVQHE